MASSEGFIQFVCDQIRNAGSVRYKKMFGEYMAYVDDKPVLLICDDIVYIKKHSELAEIMQDCEVGVPYNGAKESYILDIENQDLVEQVMPILLRLTPLPKPKKAKKVLS